MLSTNLQDHKVTHMESQHVMGTRYDTVASCRPFLNLSCHVDAKPVVAALSLVQQQFCANQVIENHTEYIAVAFGDIKV